MALSDNGVSIYAVGSCMYDLMLKMFTVHAIDKFNNISPTVMWIISSWSAVKWYFLHQYHQYNI